MRTHEQITKARVLDAIRIKEFDASNGEFIGYGSTFGGEPDAYGEVVKSGAFSDTLKEHKKSGTLPKLLWQHSPSEPIGIYREMKEDDHGLFVHGQLDTSGDVPEARKAHALMKSGAVDGLSIGFQVQKFEVDEDEEIVTLTQIKLWEVSVVTFPANQSAVVTAVKNMVWECLGRGETPSPKMFERFLREEGGLSRSQARGVMAKGFAGLTTETAPREAEGSDDELADALGGIITSQRARLLTEQLTERRHGSRT